MPLDPSASGRSWALWDLIEASKLVSKKWAKENRGVQASELKAIMASRFELESLGKDVLYFQSTSPDQVQRGWL